MLKKILLGIVGFIVVVLVVAALQPADFKITRTATIAAPPADVFAQVNELRKWEAWSPWAKLDPAMKVTYDGPPAGTGASYAWAGNSQVGEGRMTITESRSPELVRMKLEFLKPFAAVNDTEFAFKPETNQTVVTWSMSGKNNFVSKVFCLFMNMDKMVGKDFEKGLAQLKAVAETKK
jgi:uncharacterized protein YndB with AHSA1/START domain